MTIRIRPRVWRGFTLVELLVVIGIIGLLIGMLVPALRQAVLSSHSIVCMNNLRQMGASVQMYVNEFQGILPWEGYAEGDREKRHLGRWEDRAQWFNVIATYARQPMYNQLQLDDAAGLKPLPKAGDRSLYICPDAKAPTAGLKDDVVQDGYLMLWGLDDSNNSDRRKTYWNYAYNTQLDGGHEDRNLGFRWCIRQTHLKQSSITPLIVERIMAPNETNPAFTSGVGSTEVSYKEFTTRHWGGGYILMCDSHVQYFKRSELINNTTILRNDYNQPGIVIWNPDGVSN